MTFPTRPADWLTFEEARGRILSAVRLGPPETVFLGDAPGRALSTDIVARTALPPWDNSAMDGYAVRSADLEALDEAHPIVLRVVGASRPGFAWDGLVGRGEAVRIMTGAPVPAGADSVIRVEHTRTDTDESVTVLRGDDRGRNVRPAGEDMAAGDLVLARGVRIGAGQIAMLASTGHASVEVGRRPRVGILTTGDELVPPEMFDSVLAGKAIVDSNGPMLAQQVRAAGGVPVLLGPAKDSEDDLRARIEASAQVDVLITVGGASMGTHDLVKRVLEDTGFELDFWRVRVRPGSPFSFGALKRPNGEIPVFGLPGNPASAFVTFELFVRPYLRAASGFRQLERKTVRAVAAEDMASPEDLSVFLRVVLEEREGSLTARLTGPQGSGLVRSLAAADGLAVLPAGSALVRAGEPVEVVLLGPV